LVQIKSQFIRVLDVSKNMSKNNEKIKNKSFILRNLMNKAEKVHKNYIQFHRDPFHTMKGLMNNFQKCYEVAKQMN